MCFLCSLDWLGSCEHCDKKFCKKCGYILGITICDDDEIEIIAKNYANHQQTEYKELFQDFEKKCESKEDFNDFFCVECNKKFGYIEE